MATGSSRSALPSRKSHAFRPFVIVVVLLPVIGCGTLFDSWEQPGSIWARLNGEYGAGLCMSTIRPDGPEIEIPPPRPAGFCESTIEAIKELSPEIGYWVYCAPPDVESHATIIVHLMGESDVCLGQPLLSVDPSGAATWVCHPDGMFSGRRKYVHARLTPDQLDRFDEVIRRAFANIGVSLSPTYSRRVGLLSREGTARAFQFPTKMAGDGIVDLYFETNPLDGLSAIIEAHRVDEPSPESSLDSDAGTFTPFLPASIKASLGDDHRKRREEVETLLRAVAEFIGGIEEETGRLHEGK